MLQEIVMNVLFTTKLTQKRKSWEDGLLCFSSISDSSTRFHAILRNEEDKVIYQGIYKSEDGLPTVDTPETRFGPYLVQFVSIQDSPDFPTAPPPQQAPSPRRTFAPASIPRPARPVAPPIAVPPANHRIVRTVDEIFAFFAEDDPPEVTRPSLESFRIH
jgi:hypothetical protein